MNSSSVETHIVLVEPVIPQNTGSIARLCACSGSVLHLIHPLGFQVDEASVKRAGLDYWPHVDVREHLSWESFLEKEKPESLGFLSKFGKKAYTEMGVEFPKFLVFGNETTGLSDELYKRYPAQFFRIPMRTDLVRSLNLSQAVAIVLYEKLRREEFQGILVDPPVRPVL